MNTLTLYTDGDFSNDISFPLTVKPTQDVLVLITSRVPSIVSIASGYEQLLFTPLDWNNPHTVLVETCVNGDTKIDFICMSTDSKYVGLVGSVDVIVNSSPTILSKKRVDSNSQEIINIFSGNTAFIEITLSENVIKDT